MTKDKLTTMSPYSTYINAIAFDANSNDPRCSPKFIKHYTMKIDDSPETSPSHARLCRSADWLDPFGVSDWDVRNKAQEVVYAEEAFVDFDETRGDVE